MPESPASIAEIEEYLDLEDYDRDKSSLAFYTYADLPDREYWIYEYRDSDNSLCNLVVTQLKSDAGVVLTCGCSEAEHSSPQELVKELYSNGI